tara:strand:- start:45 stop:1880 length:1836 start_codon:yes stop_codon:yes gene_type:complete
MLKNIFIDATSEQETRTALTLDGKLDDFEIEPIKKNAVKSDIFLAKITRVEPSLQAAFVDFGAARHGFLPLTEIHPDYFKIPVSDQENLKKLTSQIKNDEIDDSEIENHNNENNFSQEKEFDNSRAKQLDYKKKYLNFFRKYRIQEVIKPRQVILVQINKEERGLKGAALTTFLSFAGRYCVLMPNSLNNNGISRKISDIDERKKIKNILESLNIPENMVVIVRTSGIGKTKKEINKDLDFLISQWNKIREKTLKSNAPKIIYEEGSLVKRTIRDLLSTDVNEVLIEGKKGFEIAKKYAKSIVPTLAKKIKLYKNNGKTLFNNNNIENQINDLFSLKVSLKSGGSIVINSTEALIAIDVNSGKNTIQRNIQSTALNTNLEAATEIARQVRLRDLGGLVVIDFIDMDDYRNNFKVEKALKTALHQDRARIQVGRISMFGLLELSRQRLRSSLIELSFQKCHYCNGSGIILNPNSICEQILKVVDEQLSNDKEKKNIAEVKCNTALADILLNTKRDEINNLEKKHNSKISFALDNHVSLHEPNVSLILKDKIYVEETKEVKKKANKKRIIKKVKSKKTSNIKKIASDKEESIPLSKKTRNEHQKDQKTGWWSE